MSRTGARPTEQSSEDLPEPSTGQSVYETVDRRVDRQKHVGDRVVVVHLQFHASELLNGHERPDDEVGQLAYDEDRDHRD